jgi:DNA-binding Xre family transcriptional regulator
VPVMAAPNAHPLDRLMRERQVRGAKIAAACDVDQSTVYRWKTGKSVIPADKLRPIATVLDVPVEDLLPVEPMEKAA